MTAPLVPISSWAVDTPPLCNLVMLPLARRRRASFTVYAPLLSSTPSIPPRVQAVRSHGHIPPHSDCTFKRIITVLGPDINPRCISNTLAAGSHQMDGPLTSHSSDHSIGENTTLLPEMIERSCPPLHQNTKSLVNFADTSPSSSMPRKHEGGTALAPRVA